MNSRLPVLIVGAGPTGLMMACELARRNIHFRIIDKNSERTQTSNATWIQPRTLEILKAIGIVDRFLILGNPCRAITLYVEGKELVKIPFSHVDATYPYILILAQSEIERLLIERLQEFNITIERNVELINLHQKDGTVVCTVKNGKAKEDVINAEYVIACDGVRSTVRDKCDIYFPGEDIQDQFMVADAKMGSYLPKDEIHIFFDTGTVFAASSLNSDIYRITANLHFSHARKTFTEKEVKEMANERSYGAYNVHSVSWISPFWIHGKVVEKMRVGSVFLAGDAAHIHSPAGGEGMNTGIQDAYNLAWKLALVMENKARPALLDSYEAERHPAVKEVVEKTDELTKMVLMDSDFNSKLLHFSSKILSNPVEASRKITSTIAQLDIHYKNSPIIDYKEDVNANSPRYGQLAPDVKLGKYSRLYDYLENPVHNVLMFTGVNTSQDDIQKMRVLQENIAEVFGEEIKVHLISTEEVSGFLHVISDVDSLIHERYQVKKPIVYVLRPDNYIGFCSKDLTSESIAKFLHGYLI
ncbi:MAG: FAD-dependent monooxygenase [Gammaproteobacteria bacterium]|nr:FAD-dependent monooxygenase [Gammaproteobacteria bacterium]